MDINSSVRLASALAEPCTASSEHMRSLCSNARPCGARRRTRAAICEYEPCGNHRRTLFGFLLGNHRGEVPSFQCGGTDLQGKNLVSISQEKGNYINTPCMGSARTPGFNSKLSEIPMIRHWTRRPGATRRTPGGSRRWLRLRCYTLGKRAAVRDHR